MPSLSERIAAAAKVLNPPAVDDLTGTGLWETEGELDAMTPPGAMHPMPADIYRKPDLSHLAQTHGVGKAQLPDIRNRQRP
jgi:hypothetical protein